MNHKNYGLDNYIYSFHLDFKRFLQFLTTLLKPVILWNNFAFKSKEGNLKFENDLTLSNQKVLNRN